MVAVDFLVLDADPVSKCAPRGFPQSHAFSLVWYLVRHIERIADLKVVQPFIGGIGHQFALQGARGVPAEGAEQDGRPCLEMG